MEKSELYQLDITALKALYLAESERLNNALLDGAAWEQLAEQRKYVINLGVVIDAKNHALKNALIAAALQVDFL